MRPNTAEDFWARVDRSGDCWLWTGALVKGYGRTAWQGEQRPAHRLAYELAIGPIPDGLVVDHLCRVPACVNPSHLEPVTQRENTLRGETIPARNAAKTHCRWGHPLSGENLKMKAGKWRQCRECHRLEARKARKAA